jgi:hypothetical protein
MCGLRADNTLRMNANNQATLTKIMAGPQSRPLTPDT